MISPASTSSDAPDSALTPWKRLSTSRMTRSGAVEGIESFGFDFFAGRARGSGPRPPAGEVSRREGFRQGSVAASERRGQHLLGVAGVEEAVGVDVQRRNLFAVGVFEHDVERRRTEARIAFAGSAQLAVDDRLHPVLFAVDRDDENVLVGNLAGGFDRGDRAERHFVVVGVDDCRVRMGLQQGFGDLTALVAVEVAGLAGENDHARRLGLDRLVEALLAVVGWRGADRAFEFEDLALAAGLLDRPVRDPLTFLDEIRADEGEVVDAPLGERLIDVAVDQEHRDAGLLGGEHRRNERLVLARRQEDEVDALGDHGVDVGDLLGGGIGRDGLLLTIWAKPTLYLSFFFKGGTWPKAGAMARPAAAPTDPMSACLRVMSIAFPPLPRPSRGPM